MKKSFWIGLFGIGFALGVWSYVSAQTSTGVILEPEGAGGDSWEVGADPAGVNVINNRDGQTKFFIDSATGNVGIGTLGPAQKLSVEGVIESTNGGIKFPDGSIQIKAAEGSANSLDAQDGDPADAVYVDNDGKVGIGTTTPTETLDVKGTFRAEGHQHYILSNTNISLMLNQLNNTKWAYLDQDAEGDLLF